MPLYRGDGGAGDASTDAYASQIATYAQTATTKANEASASASAASSSASAASTAETAAELLRLTQRLHRTQLLKQHRQPQSLRRIMLRLRRITQPLAHQQRLHQLPMLPTLPVQRLRQKPMQQLVQYSYNKG
jgi:(p)ppGpp synthase/HD superfamily hydrolase